MHYRNFLWLSAYLRHSCYPALVLAVLLAWPALANAETPVQTLSLPQAISRALEKHPKLAVFEYRFKALEGERLTADQAPAYELGLEAENLLGSGQLKGTDAAEYTLAISSVIELGDKRQARKRLASDRYAMAEAERKAETLSLLGRVTHAFINALALQEKIRLSEASVLLAKTSREMIEQRVERGAAPKAEALRAKAQLARRQLELDALRGNHDASRMTLATLLGDQAADFQELRGQLYALGTAPDFPKLFQQASENPAIAIYASEARMREAELALMRGQSRTDIRWQLGVRHLEENSDSALVAGISLPLGTARRNQGQLQTARAALAETGLRRESALLTLRAQLYAAWRQHQQATAAVKTMQQQIIPDLDKALELTRTAYQRGRYSYMEWQAAQSELLSARQALVDSASTALRNQALIEQLTARPLIAQDQ